MNFENYSKFMNILGEDLHAMFEHQKEYICCKEGCAYCCSEGEYPFTEIEFNYLMEGYKNLDRDIQDEIKQNYQNIKEDDKGYYCCPFLLKDNKCAVYNNRGLVCRTFGLINTGENGKGEVPFCINKGLNYSEVYDTSTKMISMEAVIQKGYKTLPKIFNLTVNNINELDLVKQLGIEFKNQKKLKQWLDEINF